VPSIGTTELLVIAVILLVLFGGKKLPEFARGVGDSIREFKRAAKE
jgi:sec-independent protein translocase protein TatA